ncbi:hypothetical protein FPV67DRAFT_379420 [Lyophyllum atratum]|nr:hypothetical protein FPV67DRAFT_379420 [Lyophyllum atratum]
MTLRLDHSRRLTSPTITTLTHLTSRSRVSRLTPYQRRLSRVQWTQAHPNSVYLPAAHLLLSAPRNKHLLSCTTPQPYPGSHPPPAPRKPRGDCNRDFLPPPSATQTLARLHRLQAHRRLQRHGAPRPPTAPRHHHADDTAHGVQARVRESVHEEHGVRRKVKRPLREHFESMGRDDERACWGEFVRRIERRPPSKAVVAQAIGVGAGVDAPQVIQPHPRGAILYHTHPSGEMMEIKGVVESIQAQATPRWVESGKAVTLCWRSRSWLRCRILMNGPLQTGQFA